MIKLFIILVAVLAFVGVISSAYGQTATPTSSPTPTTAGTSNTTVPSGAPSTGFGK